MELSKLPKQQLNPKNASAGVMVREEVRQLVEGPKDKRREEK